MVAVGIALAAAFFVASGAQAQNCALTPNASIPNLPGIGSSPASVSSMIGGAITTATTAFLLQSEAFISSPANPAPNQQGGGIWSRAVGGSLDVASSTGTVVSSPGGGTIPATSSAVSCSQKVDESFAGVQFGSDIARLNVNGWNLHLGTTAGYLGTKANLAGGAFSYTDVTGYVAGGGPFTGTTQVPFFGAYTAATFGSFAVDALLREEYYQSSLSAPGANLFGQNIDAHGISFSSSATYQWQIPNSNWFVEPSAGIIISHVQVDPFNYVTAGTPPGVSNLLPFGDTVSGTLQLNTIDSDIGRLGLRFGTTIDAGNVIWQPFGAVSVWHEFGPDLTSNYITCPGCVVVPGGFRGKEVETTISAISSTTTFGTYGQYSLGMSGQLAGTGWLGFARVDYRDGPDLVGLSGTGGIRYQFTPEATTKEFTSAKTLVHKAPVAGAVNWTGLYVGGFGGASLGMADWKYEPDEVAPHLGGYNWGGDLGYNYQIDRWLLGVESDLEKTSTKGGTACGPLVNLAGPNSSPVLGPMFQMTCNAADNWLATATGRIGYTWDRALFFGKAGGAWTDEQFSATCNAPAAVSSYGCTNPAGAPSTGLTASTNRGGWVIGCGTELALTPNWSARAEYDYISFGDRNVIASDGSVLDLGMHVSEVKIGLNYRFASALVAAKD